MARAEKLYRDKSAPMNEILPKAPRKYIAASKKKIRASNLSEISHRFTILKSSFYIVKPSLLEGTPYEKDTSISVKKHDHLSKSRYNKNN